MLPAISSAQPPKITTRVSLKAESPAVRANGTVRPSERPIIASETVRASSHGLVVAEEVVVEEQTEGRRGRCGHSGWGQNLSAGPQMGEVWVCGVSVDMVGRRGSVSRPLRGKRRFLIVTRDMVCVSLAEKMVENRKLEDEVCGKSNNLNCDDLNPRCVLW